MANTSFFGGPPPTIFSTDPATVSAALLANVASSTVGAVSGSIASSISSQLVPLVTSAQYDAWWGRSSLIPGAGEIFRALNQGRIQPNEAQGWLRWNGVLWAPNIDSIQQEGQNVGQQEQRVALWEAVRQSALSRPDISLAHTLWMQGHILEAPLEMMIKDAGGDLVAWRGIRRGLHSNLDISSLQVARNRNIITDDQYRLGLRRLGFMKPEHVTAIDKLRTVIPPISDLVYFGVRDVWDNEARRARQLIAELPEQMVHNARLQGLGGNSGVPIGDDPNGPQYNWAEVYWMAHWQNVSAQQSYEMFHRMRPGRTDRFRALGFDVQPFTQADLSRNLKIADYPLGDRPYLAAISYSQLRLYDIRAALALRARIDADPTFAATLPADLRQRMGIINRQWAVEQFRDRGLLPDDASISADLAISRASAYLNAPIQNYQNQVKLRTIREVVDSFELGLIGRGEAETLMMTQGMDVQVAASQLAMSELKIRRKTAIAHLQAVRKDYFGGVITYDEVRQSLTSAGFTADAAEKYADRWQIQRDRTRKTASTQQILKWLEEGLITQMEAVRRLGNLGWSQADQLTLLREAIVAVGKIQARTMTTAQQKQHAAARQLESNAKAAKAARRQAISDLRQRMPRVSILAWLKKGIVTPKWVQERLTAQEYSQEAITNWIREAMGVTSNGQQAGPPPQATTQPANRP